PTRPQPRDMMSAVYHPGTKRIYFFGGRRDAGLLTSDVMEYDPAAGTLVPAGDSLPTARAGTSAAYDPVSGKIFVFGGFGPGAPGTNELAQIISYDPVGHSVQPAVGNLPTARAMTAAAYDPATARIYVFGGRQFGSGAHLEQVVSFDPATEAVATVSTTLPSGRVDMAAVFEPSSGDIVLFGGDATGTWLTDVLAFHPAGSSTTLLSPLPSPLAAAAAVRHPFTGRLLLYGGADSGGPKSQVVEFDPSARTTALLAASLPSARSRAAAAADPVTLRPFIAGGTATASGFNGLLVHVQVASGTYRSPVFDTGNLSLLGNASWNPAVQADTSTALGISVRAGNAPAPGPTWSNAGAFSAVANGGTLAPLGTSRYVQFSATFTTVNAATSAVLSDLTVAFTQTAPSATLVSSAFDTGRDGNLVRSVAWSGVFQPGTTSQLQLRTAPNDGSGNPGTWSAWLGPTASTDSYTDPNSGQAVNPLHRDGSNDRFLQYRAVLITSTTLIPAHLSTVAITVNSLPAAPTLTSLVAVSTREINAAWTDNSDDETDFVLSTGTLPSATNLGISSATASAAGTGGTQSATAGGLLPNVAYFVRVRARNSPDGILSAYSNELNVFTLANAPAAPSVGAVQLTSVTLSWGAASNPPNTPYEVSYSTDGFQTHFSTPVAFAAGLTATTTDLLDLSPGTTYAFRVRALNGNALPSGFSASVATPTLVSPLTGLAGAALGTSSITWTWNTSGPAARYLVQSAASAAPLADTAATSFTLVGLSTNGPYGIQVLPYDLAGAGALSAPSTVYTLAGAPEPVLAVSLGTGAVSLSWPTNGNPLGTLYEVSLSTVGFPVAVSTPVPLAAGLSASATTLASLAAGSTHFWRVRAFNASGLPSPFVEASTQTLPGGISGLAVSALGVSSLSWTWTNTAGPAVEFFELLRASDGVVVATRAAPAFIETALSSDTAYGLRVRAVAGAGTGALSSPATAFTLAAPPAASAFTQVFRDSVTLSWSVNGNPARTVYQVEVATPGGSFALQASATGAATAVVNLTADATSQFRIRAVNGDGLATGYDAVISTFLPGLLPVPAGGFVAFSSAGARIALAWTVSPTTTVVRYDLFHDGGTGAVAYAVAFASVAAPATSYLTAPLTAGTTYLFGIRAVDERGASEKNTSVQASAVALSSEPALAAYIRSPASGARVWGDRLSLSAALAAGAASDLSRVLFQMRASSSAPWSDLVAAEAAHPNPASQAPFSMLWDATALAPGLYQFRAVARSAGGVDDPSPPITSLTLGSADPDVSQTRLSAGRVLSRLRVYRTAPALLEAADPSAAFTTTVRLSTGCTAADTDVLRVDGAPSSPPNPTASFSSPGLYRDISLESGQTALSAGRCAQLSLGRLDADRNNRVDGTETRADNMQLAFYDTAQGRWRADFPSAFSADDGGTLSGATPHLTLFAAFSPAAGDLSTVRVYPVPWRPNNADADDGKPWSAADPTSGIIFDNLPPDAKLAVYTVAGSLVWDAQGPAQGGLRRWDARTGDGRDVASGVYFLVVTGPDGATRVEKLAVIR
ncbi:MAG: fibronectin type III domain-containing protein, partial [Elusimicrobia bacterium]|nr:fibronectin type III domain-containing protein [Elusimicrobiota bacterium]